MNQKSYIRSILEYGRKVTRTHPVQNQLLFNYFQYQSSIIQMQSNIFPCFNRFRIPAQSISKGFQSAFKSLTRIQQAQFYMWNIRNYQKIFQLQKKQQSYKSENLQLALQQSDSTQGLQRSINVQLKLKDDKVFKQFTYFKAQLSQREKAIKIPGYTIQLQKYIIRRPKNSQLIHLIILQAVQHAAHLEGIGILCTQPESEDKIRMIYRLWHEAQFTKIKNMVFKIDQKPPVESANNIIPIQKNDIKKIQSLQSLANINNIFKAHHNKQKQNGQKGWANRESCKQDEVFEISQISNKQQIAISNSSIIKNKQNWANLKSVGSVQIIKSIGLKGFDQVQLSLNF